MKEIEKIKSLPRGKRWEYIWDYYWYVIVGALAVIVVGGIMLYSSLSYHKPMIELIMINTYKSSQEQEKAVQDVLAESGYELYENAVSVDTSIRFGIDGTSNAASMNQLMCTTVAGEGDVFFWYGKEFEPYISQGVLADLQEYLPEESLKAVEDKLVYATVEGLPEPYPCGVDLAGNVWAEEHGYLTGGFVGLSRGIENTDVSVAFLQYVMSQYEQ